MTEIKITKNEIADLELVLSTNNLNLDQHQRELSVLQEQLDDVEVDEDSKYNEYVEMLDCNGEIDVAGYMMYPSTILKECDPTAFRVGLSDYADSLDVEDTEEYKDIAEQIDNLESVIMDTEECIERTEEEIEELNEVLQEQLEEVDE